MPKNEGAIAVGMSVFIVVLLGLLFLRLFAIQNCDQRFCGGVEQKLLNPNDSYH